MPNKCQNRNNNRMTSVKLKLKYKRCDEPIVLVLALAVVILTVILPTTTSNGGGGGVVECANVETQIKLRNDEDFLIEEAQAAKHLNNAAAAIDNDNDEEHVHFKMYRSELKRLPYETIHRILRDKNEPIYRREDAELRYSQRRSYTPAHVIVRRSVEEEGEEKQAANSGHTAESLQSTFLNLTNSNLSGDFVALRDYKGTDLSLVREIDLSDNKLLQVNLTAFTRLQTVQLSHNALTQLPLDENSTFVTLNVSGNFVRTGTAPSNNNLRALSLSENEINNLAALNFSMLNALAALDLSCNQIENLETAFFPQRMHNLNYLNLAHNHLGAIYRETFYNLLSLNTLLLSHNNITDIDYETFLALPNLQHLDLSYNQLKGESIRALQGIPDLVKLSIAYNAEVGASMQEFVASWSLKELDASGTGLCQIPAALAQSVRTLKLTDNWLKVISCGDLDSYPLLQYLDLSNSHIDNIEDDALGRLEILEVLFLDHNNLRKVPVSLPTSLEHLFLHDNQIMDIQVQAFQGLRNLKTLDLSNNKILYLPALTLPKLLTLNLQSSGLKGLSQAIVHTLPHLRDLLLENNPIKCSDLLGIAEWASPCNMLTSEVTLAGINNREGEQIANANLGQQQQQQQRQQFMTAAKIDLKQKFVQMHNFFEKFKSNCSIKRQMTTANATMPAPNCAYAAANVATKETSESESAEAVRKSQGKMPNARKQLINFNLSNQPEASGVVMLNSNTTTKTNVSSTSESKKMHTNVSTSMKTIAIESISDMNEKAKVSEFNQKKNFTETEIKKTLQVAAAAAANNDPSDVTAATVATITVSSSTITTTTTRAFTGIDNKIDKSSKKIMNNEEMLETTKTPAAKNKIHSKTTVKNASIATTNGAMMRTTTPPIALSSTREITNLETPTKIPAHENVHLHKYVKRIFEKDTDDIRIESQIQQLQQQSNVGASEIQATASTATTEMLSALTKETSLNNTQTMMLMSENLVKAATTTTNPVIANITIKTTTATASEIINETRTMHVKPQTISTNLNSQKHYEETTTTITNLFRQQQKAMQVLQPATTMTISDNTAAAATIIKDKDLVQHQSNNNNNSQMQNIWEKHKNNFEHLAVHPYFNDISGQKENIHIKPTNEMLPNQQEQQQPKLKLRQKQMLKHILPNLNQTNASNNHNSNNNKKKSTQHKHEPMKLYIKDRHLIGTPLLMHKGENILVESEQLKLLGATSKLTTTTTLAPSSQKTLDNSQHMSKSETEKGHHQSNKQAENVEKKIKPPPPTPPLQDITGLTANDKHHAKTEEELDENANVDREQTSNIAAHKNLAKSKENTQTLAAANVASSQQQMASTTKLPQRQHGKHSGSKNDTSNVNFSKNVKKPTLIMKKMTITTTSNNKQQQQQHHYPITTATAVATNTQHHITLNTPRENEATWQRHEVAEIQQQYFNELKPSVNEEHETIVAASASSSPLSSLSASAVVHKHSTVNTPIHNGNHNELNTFSHQLHKLPEIMFSMQQQHEVEQQHHYSSDADINIDTSHERVSKSEQWLGMPSKMASNGHPGIVLLLSLSLFIVLLIGLMHVYRCGVVPWRRHLPQQRPHHQRQLNEEDAHSFLSYQQQHHQHQNSSSLQNIQKWHHSTRTQPPYTSPLHHLHARELQRNSANTMQSQLQQQEYAKQFHNVVLAHTLNSHNNIGGSQSQSSSSSRNNSSRSSTILEEDAFYIEMTPDSGQSIGNTMQQSDMLPMELLGIPARRSYSTPMDDEDDLPIAAAKTTTNSLEAKSCMAAANLSLLQSESSSTYDESDIMTKLTPPKRKFDLW